MSEPSNADGRAVIWRQLVVRAEALNDTIVMSQRRATAASAKRIHALAKDITALARAAMLLGGSRRGR